MSGKECSFLKKRTKKLSPVGQRRRRGPADISLFASFSSEKEEIYLCFLP
jgi:hypothetical protein